MKKVNIILVDFNDYRLRRKKKLGDKVIRCGLKRVLDRLNKVKPGIDFDLHLIINCSKNKRSFKWYNVSLWLTNFRKPSNKTYRSLQGIYPFINGVYFRSNIGMDIGAYNYGLQILRDRNYEGDVLFMNSSVMGPRRDNWLIDYRKLFGSIENTGLCGITLNSHNTSLPSPVFTPHVQSFFIYTNTEVLAKVFGSELPGCLISSDKNKLINEGEIGISKKVIDADYSIRCSAFPHFNYQNGDDWTIPQGDIRLIREYKEYANQV